MFEPCEQKRTEHYVRVNLAIATGSKRSRSQCETISMTVQCLYKHFVFQISHKEKLNVERKTELHKDKEGNRKRDGEKREWKRKAIAANWNKMETFTKIDSDKSKNVGEGIFHKLVLHFFFSVVVCILPLILNQPWLQPCEPNWYVLKHCTITICGNLFQQFFFCLTCLPSPRPSAFSYSICFWFLSRGYLEIHPSF